MTDATDDRRDAGGAPAQWHPDPTRRHQHRYWDGTAWTEHVADDGAVSLDPLSESSADSADQAVAAEKHCPPEVEALLPALRDATNPAGQLEAARKLSELGDPAAVEPLVEVATTPGYEYTHYVRLAAIEALGVLGDPSAAPPVVAAIVAGDTILANNAAPAIGSMLARTADQAALAPLVEKASSANLDFDDDYPDWYDPNTSEFYMDTAKEVADDLSNNCVAILSFAGEQGVECLFGVLGCPRDTVARSLGGVEDPPVDRLIKAAGAPEGKVRAAALVALCVACEGTRRDEIAGVIKAGLDDEDEQVRDAARESLRWVNQPEDEA